MAPRIKKFTANSIIYFEGDVDNNIYILKKGQVVLKYTPPDSFKEKSYKVAGGEFFGLKSAVGNYVREETAHCLTDVTTVILDENEFIQFISKDINLLSKILKVLSRELRQVVRKVNNLLGSSAITSHEGMMNYGQYYLKEGKYQKAKYFYEKILELYGDQVDKQEVQGKLTLIEQGKSSLSSDDEEAIEDTIEEEKDDEMVVQLFYDNVNLVEDGDYKNAINGFKQIIDNPDCSENYAIKSLFEIAKCFFELNQFKKSISVLTKLMNNYDNIPNLKECLFLLAESYEKNDENEKAMKLFDKISSLPPNDKFTIEAKKRLG